MSRKTSSSPSTTTTRSSTASSTPSRSKACACFLRRFRNNSLTRPRIAAGMSAAAILGLVKLLLRKRRKKQAQAFDLLGVEDAVEDLVLVVEGDELVFRDIAEVGASGEID